MKQKTFLNNYWQQQPLVIRQAFPGIQPPCSAEELAGLCCDTEAPARLVIEHGNPPWQVIQSPLQEHHFLQLPDTHWSLLVNDFEHYYPHLLDEIIAPFRFIPDWRIDDLMVSYAPEGGSVGPHIDEYDVFLIQVSGERHWMLDPDANPANLVTATDLKILNTFHPQQEWTLRPGDMLYLPPHLAHYGVAKTGTETTQGCMTYSVGFRAPNQQELLGAWLDDLLEHNEGIQRFSDPQRQPQQQKGEISTGDITALKQLLLQSTGAPATIADWLGRYLTQPKSNPPAQHFPDSHLIETEESIHCFRHPDSRIAWVQHPQNLQLFVNGEASSWPLACLYDIQYLCEYYYYKQDEMEKRLKQNHFRQLYQYLLEQDFIQTRESWEATQEA